MRDLLFGGVANPRLTDTGLLIYRVFAGLALAFLHGVGKVPPSEMFVQMVAGLGVPSHGLFAWAAAAAEFGGGLLLAAGLLTRPVALVLIVHFTIVVGLAHAGDPISTREPALFFLTTAILFLATGAGRYSADAAIAPRHARP